MKRIPLAGPWITEREVAAVAEAAASAWYADAHAHEERFERAFAAYHGARFAVALPSCTSAIHLALAALGIGPGDEVVVPEITWIATAAPVAYLGATPVFADVEEETLCLSPDSFAGCITPRTRAVIPVDLYGAIPEMDRIRAVAAAGGIAVIEDAAEAIGSEYRGGKAGRFGDIGAFSFHGSKTLTTGEGGMAILDDEALHRRILVLRDHGRAPGDTSYRNAEVGFKYRMSALQAALGLAQLGRIDELVARKRRIHDWYRRRLTGLPSVRLIGERDGVRSSHWLVTVIVEEAPGPAKDDLVAALGECGVDARPVFHPLSSLPAFRDSPDAERARRANPVAARVSARGVNLPSAPVLTEKEVAYVCDRLEAVLGGAPPSRQAASAAS